jgi:hypothetical protein
MPRGWTDGLPTTELEKTLQLSNGVHFYTFRAKILCQVHSICNVEYNVTTNIWPVIFSSLVISVWLVHAQDKCAYRLRP